MSALVDAALEGRIADARDLHYELFDLMTINYVDSNPIPVKAALAMWGLIEENYRLPLLPMDNGETASRSRKLSWRWTSSESRSLARLVAKEQPR